MKGGSGGMSDCEYGCERDPLPRHIPPGHAAFLHKRIRELTRDKRNMAKVSCNNCGERVWADGEFPEFEAREREAE